MKKTVTVILMLIISMPALTGCWDSTDITDLVIVDMMGIKKDKETDEFIVYFQIVHPTGFASQETGIESSPVYTFQVKDASIEGALNKASLMVTRKILLAKTRVILLSKDLSTKDLVEIFNFLERNRETRGTIQIAVSMQPLEKTMLTLTKINVVPGAVLADNFESAQSEYSAVHLDYRIRDVVEKFFKDGNVILPGVIFASEGGKTTEFLHDIDMSDGNAQFNGGLAFKKNAEPIFFSFEEMALYHLLQGNFKQMTLEVIKDDEPEHFLEIKKCKVKDKKKATKGQIAYQYDITCDAEYLNNKTETELQMDDLTKIEKNAEKQLQDKLILLYEKLKEENLDLLGFISEQQNETKLEDINVTFSTRIVINEVGNITKPYKEGGQQ